MKRAAGVEAAAPVVAWRTVLPASMHGDNGGVFGGLEAVVAGFPGTRFHRVGLTVGEGGIDFGFGLGDGAAYGMFV